MRSRSLHAYVVLVGLLFLVQNLPGQSTGEAAYDAQNYDDAIANWESVLEKYPDLKSLHYNIGNARYQKQAFEKAREHYEQALSSPDVAERADAYYNLGNAYLAENQYKEATEMYKNALKLRPDDPDAKANLEMLLKMPPPPPQQSQNQQNQEQQQNEQQNQEQQSQQQESNDDNQQQDDAEPEQNQEQQEQTGAEERDSSEEPPQSQDAKQQNEPELTEDQQLAARQLLNALRDREIENMKEMIQQQTKGPRLEKDW
ncbi:MAG: tetratricopeptide repeat protein [Lentisphaeria bacterium]|nr:tetratricopeptide repeat protein [Candidatus Neomarinimicrobiota bacterium]MCF7842922.1 tetratricopeptide repeat protein [Lentisphaeria bacterium]